MWLTRITESLLTRPWRTLIIVLIISAVPVIGAFGILIAAFVTLTKSAKEGALLTIAATLPSFGSLYFPEHGAALGFVWAMIGFTVLNNFFTWLFAFMLRKQMNFSAVIQIAALIGVLAVSIVHLAYPNIVEWWGSQLYAYYEQAKTANNNLVAATPQTSEEIATLVESVKQYTTGYIAMLILLLAITTVMVAQWWQAKVFMPGNLKRELHYIRLNQLTGILFILGIVFAYTGNSVVIDIMPIAYVLFFVTGLSLAHYCFGIMRNKYVTFWLIFFYAIVIIGMPASAILIVVFALLDIWFDFRKRFKTIE